MSAFFRNRHTHGIDRRAWPIVLIVYCNAPVFPELAVWASGSSKACRPGRRDTDRMELTGRGRIDRLLLERPCVRRHFCSTWNMILRFTRLHHKNRSAQDILASNVFYAGHFYGRLAVTKECVPMKLFFRSEYVCGGQRLKNRFRNDRRASALFCAFVIPC